LFIIPVGLFPNHLKNNFKGTPKSFEEEEFLFMFVATILGILFYYLQ